MTLRNETSTVADDPEHEAVHRILHGPLDDLVQERLSFEDAAEQVGAIRADFNPADWWYVDSTIESKLRTGDALFGKNVLEVWQKLTSATDPAHTG